MRATSLGEYSDDDSSDIRTVRTNTTNVFSQGSSSYYTNPTLPPPSSHSHSHSHPTASLSLPVTLSSIHPNPDDGDQTTLTDDNMSPTSIMTNYESYSKLGAAPIYQNVVVPARGGVAPNTRSGTGGRTAAAAVPPPLGGGVALNTIVEDETAATVSPHKVYHPPSYYKKNQQRPAKNGATSTAPSLAAGTTGNSNNNNNNNNNKKNDVVAGATQNTGTGTSSSSTGSVTSSTISSHGSSSQTTQPTNDPVASRTATTAAATTTTTTAFSIFKRMTSAHSPLRNRSPSPHSLQPESTAATTTTTTLVVANSTPGDSVPLQPPPPPPTRSLRNYMHTLAYKSRRGSPSPDSTVPSGRITPPSIINNNKKMEPQHLPIPTSPTTSVQSTTSSSHHSRTGHHPSSSGSSPPPPSEVPNPSLLPELTATPIKSNSSNRSSSSSNGNDPTLRKNQEEFLLKSKVTTTACPTTASTITTTTTTTSSSSNSSNGSATSKSAATPYCNPVLKSVSSKLFVPSDDGLSRTEPRPVTTATTAKTTTSTTMDRADTPKARLNLEIIDQMAHPGGDMTTTPMGPPDLSHLPKESFRLWTDDDSAFGRSWYSFSTSPFQNDDSLDMSMESNPSTTLGMAPVVMERHVPRVVANVSNTTNVMDASKVPTTIAPPPPPPHVTSNILPNVVPPSGKLSLSLLQLQHLHRQSSIGSTDNEDEDDTIHRYPSMVSSEYEDEGGTSTLSGTINNPTDDCTTLGGGASFDFSVSACIDDESLSKKEKASAATMTASRSNPIVYSNVGQAFSRGDMIPSQHSINAPNAASRSLLQPPVALDRPMRRRSSSAGKRSLSSPPPSSLEVIDEHTISHIDHNKLSQLQESASEPSSIGNNTTSNETMVVLSLADASGSSSSKKQGSGPTEGHKQEVVRVVRRLDSIQIGIILLASVALAAIFCATFCIVGSCHVGKNKNTTNRNRVLLRGIPVVPQPMQWSPVTPQQYLRTSTKDGTIP